PMHVRLSTNNRPGFLAHRYSQSILRRNAISKMLDGGGGLNAGGIVEVFNADGNTMQGGAPLISFDFFLGRSRERDTDFNRVRLWRIVRLPPLLLVCALKDTILLVDVWFTVGFAQIRRDMEPPVALLPIMTLFVLRVEEQLGEQAVLAIRYTSKLEIQVSRVFETHRNLPIQIRADFKTFTISPLLRRNLPVNCHGTPTGN